MRLLPKKQVPEVTREAIIHFNRSLTRNLLIFRNTVGTLPERHIKLLLIGPMASGKTEVGHVLSRQHRQIYEPTNGVQYFRMEFPERQVSITEVGGSTEMQKIWHHYFLTTMGIIYCFDMSATYEELRNSFDCFQRTLMHPHVRGKPFLLLATKADLADEGVQLYDIENTFQLEALAKYYLSSAHVCYIGKNMELSSMWDGVAWLVKHIIDNMDSLQARLRADANMKVNINGKNMLNKRNCNSVHSIDMAGTTQSIDNRRANQARSVSPISVSSEKHGAQEGKQFIHKYEWVVKKNYK